MDELFGPIIGITLVLMAVFIPAAFLPGLTGKMYAQFALVIAATALISAINAATLKPTQCAMWLRPPVPPEKRNIVFRGVNYLYNPVERAYVGLISRMAHHSLLMVLIALILAGVAFWGIGRLPTAFIPTEDQGYLLVAAQLPDGASLERTQNAMAQVTKAALATPGVDQVVEINGMSVLDNSATLSSAGVAYVILKDWGVRGKAKGEDLRSIYTHLQGQLDKLPDAVALVLVPPPIQGIGNANGFTMQLELRDGNFDWAKLNRITQTVIADANSQTALQHVSTSYRADVPQIEVDVDRTKAETLHVSVGDVFNVLSGYIGSSYINQFNLFGRTFQVYVQADSKYRLRTADLEALYARSSDGNMVPLGALVTTRPVVGPALISLYNLYPSSSIIGLPAQGFSSGQAMSLMEEIGNKVLPPGAGYEWTAMSVPGKSGRRADLHGIRDGDPAGLSVPGRPVRKLDCPARRHPGCPAGAAWPWDHVGHAGTGQQPVYADRHRPAGGTGGQERDPDRRSRARTPRRGRTDHAGRGRCRSHSLPPDHHDLVCLHPGRSTAGYRHRRWRRSARIAGPAGVQRHDRVHLPGGAVRAVVLRGAAAAGGTDEGAEEGADAQRG